MTFAFTDPIDYSNFKRETSSEDASSSFLDGFAASAASNSPPALVSTTGLNLTSSAVAVVKPTISAPETLGPLEEDPFLNTEFEKKPLIEDHTVVDDHVSQGKASEISAVATETTESSPFSTQLPLVSPPDTKPTGKKTKNIFSCLKCLKSDRIVFSTFKVPNKPTCTIVSLKKLKMTSNMASNDL